MDEKVWRMVDVKYTHTVINRLEERSLTWMGHMLIMDDSFKGKLVSKKKKRSDILVRRKREKKLSKIKSGEWKYKKYKKEISIGNMAIPVKLPMEKKMEDDSNINTLFITIFIPLLFWLIKIY